MKKLFLLLLFLNFVSANTLLDDFKKGFYNKICNNRWSYISKYRNKREDLLSLVAYACLKTDSITPAVDVARFLKKTSIGRKNATYIATLFLMKKLLLEYILDNDIKIRSIKLPIITDNNLGKVFYLLQTLNEDNIIKKGKKLILKSKNYKFIVYPSRKYNITIVSFKDGKYIKKEIFW